MKDTSSPVAVVDDESWLLALFGAEKLSEPSQQTKEESKNRKGRRGTYLGSDVQSLREALAFLDPETGAVKVDETPGH